MTAATQLRDFATCDREPIHVPGSIQPHGVLLIVDPVAGTILQAGGDTGRMVGVETGNLLGRPVAEVLGIDLWALTARQVPGDAVYLGSVVPPARAAALDVLCHERDGVLVLELEPAPSIRPTAAQLLASVWAAAAALGGACDLQGLYDAAAREVRALAGYDRVMLYRFHDDGSGSVVAEHKADELPSFLNHRYPATDIPQQARELYLRNLIRLTPDVGYVPALLVPALCPATGRALDMSDCTLRGVSPVHIRYLQNMGVIASMSVSVVRDGALWGLIACHHDTPKTLPYELRQACKHVGQILAQQIAARENAGRHTEGLRLRLAVDELITTLSASASIENALAEHCAKVSAAIPSDGAAVVHGYKAAATGLTPDLAQIRELAGWLLAKEQPHPYTTDRLSDAYAAAGAYRAAASGLLTAVASRTDPLLLLWFRAEQVETIGWAGNPHVPLEVNLALGTLNPRKSFALWHETVHGQSRRWTAAEIASAKRLGQVVSDLRQRQQIRELNVRLRCSLAEQEELVAQKDLLNQQLYAAQRAAEEASRAKSDFLAAMSHEIRTPLTGVLGMADLLAAEELSKKQQRYADAIRTSGRHLLSVINDILDFSRIEAGKLELEEIDFKLGDLVEEVQSLMAPQAAERGLELRMMPISPAAPVVRGDPTRLRQVLLNLVGNGLKFTHQGGVEVQVTNQSEGGDSGRVRLRFAVRDSGIGIAAHKQGGLFDEFTQADRSTSRTYGGSGLGLAICKRLVEAMAGMIGVESAPGQGSTFWFEVPLLHGVTKALVTRGSYQPADTTCLRVLVADDVAVNRDLLAAMLGRYGHDVLLAEDGAAALALVAREHPDVVLMDVQMPMMDGLEATRRIRRLPPPAGMVPILALTASVMASERERYLAAGMNLCLAKPVVWPDLFAALADVAAGVASAQRQTDGQIPAITLAPITKEVPLLDLVMLEGMGGKLPAEILRKLLARGLEGAGMSCDRLKNALENLDTGMLAREAHQLCGTAGSIGLARISALAARIEDCVGHGKDTTALVAELESLLVSTAEAVAQFALDT